MPTRNDDELLRQLFELTKEAITNRYADARKLAPNNAVTILSNDDPLMKMLALLTERLSRAIDGVSPEVLDRIYRAADMLEQGRKWESNKAAEVTIASTFGATFASNLRGKYKKHLEVARSIIRIHKALLESTDVVFSRALSDHIHESILSRKASD